MNRTHNLRRHRLYSIWRNIKTRCYNPNTHNFSNYGGKEIKVCDEWLNDPLAFFNWSMENGYTPELTIDWIDPDRDYSPNNCRWVTIEIQQRNKGKYKNGKVKYIGVSRIPSSNSFTASIRLNRKFIYLGCFTTPEAAARARDQYLDQNGLIGYRKNFQL